MHASLVPLYVVGFASSVGRESPAWVQVDAPAPPLMTSAKLDVRMLLSYCLGRILERLLVFSLSYRAAVLLCSVDARESTGIYGRCENLKVSYCEGPDTALP